MKPFRLLPLLVCLLVSWLGYAQPASRAILTGRITNATTGEPLPFASVYINGTKLGTTTDEKGLFVLPDVPFGLAELVASYTGFMATRTSLDIKEIRPRLLEITLFPMTNQLADVVVKVKKDRRWAGQVERFQRELLGTSPLAGKCMLTNPQVLSFQESGPTLSAEASAPLVIDNLALGYRIQYTLQAFRVQSQTGHVVFGGTTLFSDLTPESPKQAKQWQRNREIAYTGSLRHLMASLAAGTHEKEGFMVFQTNPERMLVTPPTPTLTNEIGRYLKRFDPKTMVLVGGQPHERWLVSMSPLEIFYTRLNPRNSPYSDAPYAYSKLILPQKTLGFTTAGAITAPRGFDVVGYHSDDRLASALPDDWQRTPEAARDSVTEAQAAAPPSVSGANAYPTAVLHIDKPLYLTGDRLWLSGYVLNPGLRRSDTALIGPALAVELWSAANQLVQHQWLAVERGRAVGTFRLSDTLTTGTYWLRAYTDADRQQGQPAFERPLLVVNGRQADGPPRGTLPIAGTASPDAPNGATTWPRSGRQPLLKISPVQMQVGREKPTDAELTRHTVKLTLQDEQGRAVFAQLSVAITDAEQVPADSGTYLTSSRATIGGGEGSPSTVGLMVRGRVGSADKPPYNVMLFTADGGDVQTRTVQTDAKGAFTFSQLDLPDTAQAVVRVTNRRGQPTDARVTFVSPVAVFGPLPVWSDAPRLLANWRAMIAAARQRQTTDPTQYRQTDARQLAEVQVRAPRPFDDRPDDIKRRSFHDRVDQTIILDEKTAYVANLYYLIQAKVPSTRVEEVLTNGRTTYSVKFPGTSVGAIVAAPPPVAMGSTAPPRPIPGDVPMQNPLFLMDGFPVNDTDGTQLLAFAPSDIERIEVLKSGSVAAQYGVNAARGVIALYTKINRDPARVKGVARHTLLGYTTPAVFSPQTDVLAWLPLATTDAFGQLSVPLNVPALPRKLRVLIQGITDTGQIFACEQVIGH